jgi:hypothetical protein
MTEQGVVWEDVCVLKSKEMQPPAALPHTHKGGIWKGAMQQQSGKDTKLQHTHTNACLFKIVPAPVFWRVGHAQVIC